MNFKWELVWGLSCRILDLPGFGRAFGHACFWRFWDIRICQHLLTGFYDIWVFRIVGAVAFAFSQVLGEGLGCRNI